MCFGGSAPASPPAPPPPPQYAQTPTPAAQRTSTANAVGGANMGTLLTGGQGAAINNDSLGKNSLLGLS